MSERFRKNDFLLLGITAAFLLAGWFLFSFFGKEKGGRIQITVDGQLYGTYSLAQDQTVDIMIGDRTANVLVIKDGSANMIKADCPDKLCVHQKAVSSKRETIVCLPNKVIAEVTGGSEAEMDLIT